MKRVYLLLFWVLATTASLLAQSPGGQRMTVEERAQSITEWMTKDLSLSDEQVVQVDSINLIFVKAQQIIFETFRGEDREKMREYIAALEKEKESALSEVLTEEQLSTYVRLREEQAQQRQQRRGNREGRGGRNR